VREQRTAIRSRKGCDEVHEHVRIWQFSYAPLDFRELSQHGGDEDWLIHVPANMMEMYMPWLENGIRQGWFGCSDVSEHPQPDGSRIYIGAHA
jgi:hypothetical protein